MGSAVFHGGFSTFTAFVLTSTSDSYVFNTFFKMFAMVVLFGLVHGLVLLPICLSILGPLPHKEEEEEEEEEEKKDANDRQKVENGEAQELALLNGDAAAAAAADHVSVAADAGDA
jgi:hypothetical protein